MGLIYYGNQIQDLQLKCISSHVILVSLSNQFIWAVYKHM